MNESFIDLSNVSKHGTLHFSVGHSTVAALGVATNDCYYFSELSAPTRPAGDFTRCC